MKITKISLCLFFVVMVFRLEAPGVYLWEFAQGQDRSCCLFFSGTDVCNPNIPCTGCVRSDLSGIYDYISRLLNTEKASGGFSYTKLLQSTQFYIRHVFSSSITQLNYQPNQHRSVQFLHEIQESASTSSKTEKNSKPVTPPATSTKSKTETEEAVLKYLMKLGLARPLK